MVTEDDYLQGLREYIEGCGGDAAMVASWGVHTKQREIGATAGTSDTYFVSAEGRKFRSLPEVARHFGLDPKGGSAKGVSVASRRKSLAKAEATPSAGADDGGNGGGGGGGNGGDVTRDPEYTEHYPVDDALLDGLQDDRFAPTAPRPPAEPPAWAAELPAAELLEVSDFLLAMGPLLGLPKIGGAAALAGCSTARRRPRSPSSTSSCCASCSPSRR